MYLVDLMFGAIFLNCAKEYFYTYIFAYIFLHILHCGRWPFIFAQTSVETQA